MKKLIITILALMGGSFATLYSQDQQACWLSREGNLMNAGLNLNLSTIDIKSNRMVVFTPMIIGEKDTISLSSIGLLGRRRYFYYERNERRYPDVFENENFRKKDCPESFRWDEFMPYQDWMDGATLTLHKQVYGCCNDVIDESFIALERFKQYNPVFQWIVPEAEQIKIRSLQGSAYVDFVVSTTDIRPDYRNNRRELHKILGTIDSLKADSDITMDTIFIKGFASPESPYANNTKLAQGRTKALKDHVSNLYQFNEDFIITSYEPEDWDGLRRFVESSDIANKEAILEIIDCDLEPDPKEWRLKSRFPKEYRYLLDNCYPTLRHSDYKIVYNIRTYTDPEELKKVFLESPAKLSLREFFHLSSAYEPGTEDFSKIFEVAVLVYPFNETANLNAANAAMGIGELEKAERYLTKAGDTPEAVYARGVLAALKQNYAEAKSSFEEAAEIASKTGQMHIKDAAKTAYNEMDKFIR